MTGREGFRELTRDEIAAVAGGTTQTSCNFISNIISCICSFLSSCFGGGHGSDIRLKHDIVPLGRLANGLGLYRFSYNGSDKVYVGVMAHEVQSVVPEAVIRGWDGYLRVNYDRLGLKFQTWDEWIASGKKIQTTGTN